jgi:hypothetical protein
LRLRALCKCEAGKGEDKEADQGRMPHSAHRLAVANPRSIPTW